MLIYPNFSPQFLAVLEDVQTPLTTALQYPQLAAASRLDLGNANKYLSHHAQEIIEIALSDRIDPSTSLLINILSFQVRDLFLAILNKTNFSEKATEILSNPDSSDQIIARLSIVTLSALLTLPEESSKHCTFIFQLLKRCGNNSVFNLFSTILSTDERCESARKWLHNIGFFNQILSELNSIDFDHYRGTEEDENKTTYDHVYFEATALYTLMSKCAPLEIFKGNILNINTILILKKNFKVEPPTFVKNARWKAINSVIRKENANDMSSILPEAISIISAHLPKVYEYRTNAISFIGSMIKFSPAFASYAVDEKVPNYILTLLLRFQNCTILHSAIVDFITKTIEILPIGVNLAQIFAPIIADEGSAQKNKVFLPTVFAIADVIHHAAKKNKEINQALSYFSEFDDFCKHQLPNYQSRYKKSYGGKLKGSFSDFFNNIVFE